MFFNISKLPKAPPAHICHTDNVSQVWETKYHGSQWNIFDTWWKLTFYVPSIPTIFYACFVIQTSFISVQVRIDRPLSNFWLSCGAFKAPATFYLPITPLFVLSCFASLVLQSLRLFDFPDFLIMNGMVAYSFILSIRYGKATSYQTINFNWVSIESAQKTHQSKLN